MHTAAPLHTYFNPPEAAEYLRVTVRTLIAWRRSGSGPKYLRLGGPTGRVRYERAQLDRWMRARQHAQTAAERSSASEAG